MQISAQAYPIPKSGGTYWFRLLSDLGIPLTLSSVSCSTSSVNTSIYIDGSKYIFSATFPSNTSSSAYKTYVFTVTYSVNSVSHTDTFEIEQEFSSDYVKTIVSEEKDFYIPFVQTLNCDFETNLDPTNFNVTGTYINTDSTATAPHYSSVSEYIIAAKNGELTAGQWVYVDGKWNSNYSVSYSTGNYIYNVMWIDQDATSGSGVNPHIEFDKLFGTNATKFYSKPSDATLETYRTIGFRHKDISSSATYVIISTSAFIQAATNSAWWNTSTVDGTTCTKPHIFYYNWDFTDTTYSSIGTNQYRFTHYYTSPPGLARNIVVSIEPFGTYTGEKIFKQVPADSVTISKTDFVKSYTAGSRYDPIGTFTNFDYDSSYFSVTFPDGKPEWITGATITNPSSNTLRLTYYVTENTGSTIRTCNARFNWLDKYQDITLSQKPAGGSITAEHNPAVVQGAGGTYYYDKLTLTNIDATTLSVSNTQTGYFTTAIVDQDGYKCLRIYTRFGNICGNSVITDTAVITATDTNGDTVTLNVPINQSNETADFVFTPYTSTGNYYEVSAQGETIDFTLNNQTCAGASNPGYHLTGVTRVYDSDNVDYTYTTSFVSGVLHCYVTFPANSGAETGYKYLYFTVTDDFVPGRTDVQESTFYFKQLEVPAGSINITTNDPLWYNSSSPTLASDLSYSQYVYFTSTNVDTSTITCSGYDSNIISSFSFNSAKTRVTLYVTANATNSRRSTNLTISGTDTRGNTVSDTITINQVAYNEGIKVYVTSPTGTSSSNPAIIENNTLTVLFTARNLRNLGFNGTMASYITNSTITNISGDNYQAVLTFSDNGSTVRNGTLYVVGTNDVSGSPLTSSWSSPSFRVRQPIAGGAITLDRNEIIVPANSNYDHRDVRVTSTNINGSLTPSITGDVTGTFSWYTYSGYSYLLFTPDNNTTQNTLTGTITVSGTDYNGDTITASYTVTQKPYNPFLNFLGGGYQRIRNTESRRDVSIAVQGVSITGVSIDESSSVSAFGTYVTSTSFAQEDATHYTYTINTRDNNSHQQSNIAFLHPVNLSTEFGKNLWVTDYNISGANQSVTIMKCGIAGTLSVSPTSRRVDAAAGSTSFTIYKDSYLTGTVSVDEYTGTMNITNASISSSTLNVSYGANNGVIDKTATIKISGTDYQGLKVEATAGLIQSVLSYLNFIDTSKAIAQDATSVSFRISDLNVSNLEVSTSGSVVVTQNSFTSTSEGHLLTLTVAANNTRVSRSSTITVSAKDPYNNTITSTARLTQAGLDGLLTIDPTTRTVPKTGSTFVINVASDGIDTSTITATTSGNISFDGLVWSSGRTKLTVGYNTNAGSTDLTGTVTVSGVDYNGNTQTATCTVTQVTADSSLTITPNQQIVDTTESTTATFTINHTYVTLGNVSFSGDTYYVNGYNLQNDTLTVNLRTVTTAMEAVVNVTISGYDLGGEEITDTAVLKIWGLDGYFNITPSGGWNRNKDAGNVSFTVSTFGIRSNSVTRVVDQTWATLVTSEQINYTAYSGIPTTWDAHRDCTLTISGVDYKGNVITETRLLRQYALDADITINPTTASIEYDGYVDVEVTVIGAIPIPTISGSGTKVWLNEWGTETIRTNVARITPPINQQFQSKTYQYSFGNTPLYSGGSISRTLTVTQAAKPATIVLTPATSTVTKEAGSIVYDITVDGVTQSSLQRTWNATHSGMISSATFNADKTQLTVVYTANTLVANRVGTISVYSDSLGTRVTGKAVITQTGVDPVLSGYDMAIGYHQSSATNLITTKGVGNLEVSFSGNVTINNYRFESTTGGYNLIVETPNNDTTTTYTSVATVTGTVTEGQYEGQTRTITFNVYKYGIESVTLTPSSRLLEYGQNTTTYTVNAINVNNLQVSVSGDSSFITNRTLSNGTLTITTADFAAKTAKNATITVSGTGFTGTISGSATLTKYGPDGTITASSRTLTFPRSAYSKNVTVTIEGITGSVVPTYTGTISPSNISLSGSTLTVALNANTTSDDLTGTITLTGTDYKGKTITETISVVQKPYDSLIQLDPSSRTVNKNAGSTTYTLITDSVDLSTLRVSYSGTSITNATRNGDTITVTYRENTVVATRNNTVTVTATDIYGTSISATADLFQTGIDPTISANNISILSTQANATAFVATNGIGLPASVSFSGNVNITDHSVSSTSGGLNVNLVTADNLTNSPLTSTATITATVTEGQYAGETRTATFTITKFGLEGVVTITPETLTVRKAGQIVVFDVTLGNMQNNTVTASTGTFNSDKSQLTVTVGQNTNSSDRTINVVVSGTDNNGNTKSATAVISQYGIDPYVTISPASRTLRSDTANTTYSVTAYKVDSLEFDFTGAVTVTDYRYEGSTLYVTTADNTDQFQQMTVITVSGVDELGSSVSATARLIKAGVGGGILVDSDYTIPSNAGSLAIEYGLEEVDPDSIIITTSGDINVTGILLNREDKYALISYGANSSGDPITGKIFISGIGEDGLPKVSVIDLTQLGSGYRIVIDPDVINVAYSSTSSSATVTSTGIASTTFEYGGSLVPSSCTFNKNASNSGTISATYSANNTDEYKHLYMTINGITTGGSNVTSSAVINQSIDPSSGPYIFLLQPASQSVKVVEAAQTTVSYLINSIKGYEEIDYSITGFILSGRWGTRPSADGKKVIVPLNTHSEEREVKVIYTQDISLNTLTPRIIQQEGVEPDVNPIWKEFETRADVNDFVEYHIKLGSDIIYAGKAYKYPDESKVSWSINDAVSNYLGNGISFVEGIQQIPEYSKDFYMEDNVGDKFIETFYNSWAYKDTDYWLSDPIDNRVDPRQWLPVSFLSTNYEMITVGGRTYAAFKENDGWTVMTRLRNHIVNCNDIAAVGEDGTRLNYRYDKGDYVLYYSNAYGGWDSLLCNGTSKKTDNIEHMNYRKKSKNQSQFSKVNYQNNITPTWSLNTGITVDGQKMYHLLESTMVYLHNLETDEIIPVVITNSQCEYLTYTNNGKKPYFYNITVEESNQKLRK